jgi:hypothetical protein
MATNGTTNGNGLRKKITLGSLPANTANMLTLESEGIEQTGRTGLQYRYMLSGGKIMWVEPGQHDMIQRTGAGEGDTIKIVKRETRNGNRKGPLDWQITLASQQEDEPPAARDAFDAHLQETAARTAPPQPRPAAPVQAPPAAARETSPRVEQAPAATASVALPAQTSMLAAALASAIDATATAESYADAHGRRVTFTSEDIRAMGITTYMRLLDRGGKP